MSYTAKGGYPASAGTSLSSRPKTIVKKTTKPKKPKKVKK